MRWMLGILLAIAIVSGLGLFAVQLGSGVDISPVTPQRTAATSSDGSEGLDRFRLDGVRVETFSQTLERPLFWQTRRPKPATAPAVVVPTPPPEPVGLALRLVGVLKGDDGKPRALIVSPQQPNGRWLEEGGEVDGWRLTRIGNNVVSVESGGRRHELRMN